MKSELPIPSGIDPVIAFGVHDSNLRLLERLLKVKIYPRGDQILIIEGNEKPSQIAVGVLKNLFKMSIGNVPISHNEISILIEKIENTMGDYSLEKICTEGLLVSKKTKNQPRRIKPRSSNQIEYIQKILDYDMVFSIGPAGTGKTYLAVAVALNMLTQGMVHKVILTRPVIEAGENLGFLPGTLEEKINPYIRPLYDAIDDMLTPEETRYYTENRIIELAPLAYMRGRTLSNAFIILDEAQNTSTMQMKMFLTRLGENSKMVITGDVTQVDLPSEQESGLKQAETLFKGIEGIAFHYFTSTDVIRHRLVKQIIDVYERKEREQWEIIPKK